MCFVSDSSQPFLVVGTHSTSLGLFSFTWLPLTFHEDCPGIAVTQATEYGIGALWSNHPDLGYCKQNNTLYALMNNVWTTTSSHDDRV